MKKLKKRAFLKLLKLAVNCPAVVVKQSKASYLIDVLGMLKVEGSNPGHPEMFIFVSECRDKSATSPSDGIDHEVDT